MLPCECTECKQASKYAWCSRQPRPPCSTHKHVCIAPTKGPCSLSQGLRALAAGTLAWMVSSRPVCRSTAVLAYHCWVMSTACCAYNVLIFLSACSTHPRQPACLFLCVRACQCMRACSTLLWVCTCAVKNKWSYTHRAMSGTCVGISMAPSCPWPWFLGPAGQNG